mgnify:CR=1 FL=1|tara:strand:- start:2556 stop:3863 length:1308 start_codon:yes stop_codon:yes gene_type:complete
MTFVLFDTESSGLPKNGITKFKDMDNMSTCRLIELGWQVRDSETYELIKNRGSLINYDGLHIPLDTTEHNNITEEMVRKDGIKLDSIIFEFMEDVANSDYIGGYNVVFDVLVIHSEVIRLLGTNTANKMMREKFDRTLKLCLQMVTNIHRKELGMNDDFKGTLKNVYKHLFNEDFLAHRAIDDVEATFRLLKHYSDLGILKREHFRYRHDQIQTIKFAHKVDPEYVKLVLNSPRNEAMTSIRTKRMKMMKEKPSNKSKTDTKSSTKKSHNSATYGESTYPEHKLYLEMLMNYVAPDYGDDYQRVKSEVNKKYKSECYYCGNIFSGCVRTDELDGNMRNLDSSNYVHSCFYCYAVRYQWDIAKMVELRESDMDQLQIIQKIYSLYKSNGNKVPSNEEVDSSSKKMDHAKAVELIKSGSKTIKAFPIMKTDKCKFLI